MAVYVGGTKYDIVIGGSICELKLRSSTPITNGIKLLSSDGDILVDSEALYLTAIEYIKSMSSDGYILQDAENKYLTIKKG